MFFLIKDDARILQKQDLALKYMLKKGLLNKFAFYAALQ